jgi:hypothetical protein
MVKVTIPEDCGNAPKIQFIKDFCIANAKAEIKTVMSMLSDDIILEIPGYKTASGKDSVEDLLLKDSQRSKVAELIMENIISHGNRGAANGKLKFTDGGVVAFSSVYTFSNHSKNAKLKLIQTYSIILEEL